ncbi:MAG: hypothetical protein KTR32_13925 [Granulosicoccus sp.]|nr:hypothetical protein [Granulosicoccus sp.]
MSALPDYRLHRFGQILRRTVVGSSHVSALLLAMALPSVFCNVVLASSFGVVVPGLGGDVEYEESFGEWTNDFATALQSLDSDDSRISRLKPGAQREEILEAIEEKANALQQWVQKMSDSAAGEEARVDPIFILVLVGHGTADSNTWRFNIDGPDLTTEDLVVALNAVPAAKQLVVLAASASGATLEALAQPGRVVITATKSGGEINAVRFPGFLAEALKDEAADYDRNEILTAAEAYRFAEGRTRDAYEKEKLLASEHSRLRGDGAAEIAVALLGSLKGAKDDPVVASLLDQRLVLEQNFKTLTSNKINLSVDEYYGELESLLIDIARLQQSIDDATGWSDNDS